MADNPFENIETIFRILCERLDAERARSKAYWASPKGQLVAAERRATAQAQREAEFELRRGEIEALQAEVKELAAERTQLQATLAAMRNLNARAEVIAEINDVSAALAKSNLKVHQLMAGTIASPKAVQKVFGFRSAKVLRRAR